MDPNNHERLSELFQHAIALPARERAAYVDTVCGDDDALRKALLDLLAADTAGPAIPSVADGIPAGILDHGHPALGHPKQIGEFRILGVLGEGGMGTVFDAEQEHPRRRVALKVLRTAFASEELLRRFMLESDLLGRLQHPGIAQIHAAGQAETPTGPLPYFAMERVEGERLDSWAARNEPAPREVANTVGTIAEAVHHAHLNGVIHRDLKPANILIDQDGNPRILDFGVARATDAESGESLATHYGSIVGTLPYMSPEQVSGDPHAVDLRTDVYALACIAYELLCGSVPIDVAKTSVTTAVKRIEESEPIRLQHRVANIDSDLDAIVHKGLEKDKDQRYESAAAFASDLRRYLNHLPVNAQPLTLGYQLRKLAARNPQMVRTLALLLGVVVLGVIGTTSGWIRAEARGKEIEQKSQDLTREASRRARVHDFLLDDLLRAADPWEEGRNRLLIDHLAAASAQVGQAFSEDPDLEAEVRVTLGQTLRNLGEYKQAEAHLIRALEIRERLFGKASRPSLEAAQHLAHIWWDLERYEESKALAAASLEIAENTFGPRDSMTATLIHRLGLVAQSEGDFATAVERFSRERQILLDDRGPDHINTLRATSNLALATLQSRDMARAEELSLDTLTRRRATLGPTHPDTLFSVAQLANLRLRQGRTEEAVIMLTEAREGLLVTLGSKNYYTADTSHKLSAALMEREEFEEALKLLELTGSEYGASENASTMLLGRIENSRATALQKLKRNDEALAAFERSLELRKDAYGPRSTQVATALNNLGSFYASVAGGLEQSLNYLTQSMEIRQEILGNDDPELIVSYTNVGRLNLILGDTDEALLLLDQALAIVDETYEGDHRLRASVLVNLSDCLSRMGERDRTVKILQEVEPMLERLYDPGHGSGDFLRSLTVDARQRLAETSDERPQ